MTKPKPRKPRKPLPASFLALPEMPAEDHLGMAERYLSLAGRHIDTAGDLAGTSDADMLACYASNVLQGSLSLIRELRAAIRAERRGK